jgi:hypothetical protein
VLNLDIHAQRSTPAAPWCGPALVAIRRAQPPPTRWHVPIRREREFGYYLGAAAILAALIPISIAVVVNFA